MYAVFIKRMSGLLALLALLTAGCQGPTVPPEALPAVLVGEGGEARAEISRAMSRALGGVPVTLSHTAFTQSSRLFIDQGVPRDGQSRAQNGKMESAPRRFELMILGEDCYLSGPDDDTMVRLNGVRCKALLRP